MSWVSDLFKTQFFPSLRGEEKLNHLATPFPSPPGRSADLPGALGHPSPPQGVCGPVGSWSMHSVLGLLAALPSSCAVVAFCCPLGWPMCSVLECIKHEVSAPCLQHCGHLPTPSLSSTASACLAAEGGLGHADCQRAAGASLTTSRTGGSAQVSRVPGVLSTHLDLPKSSSFHGGVSFLDCPHFSLQAGVYTQ